MERRIMIGFRKPQDKEQRKMEKMIAQNNVAIKVHQQNGHYLKVIALKGTDVPDVIDF